MEKFKDAKGQNDLCQHPKHPHVDLDKDEGQQKEK